MKKLKFMNVDGAFTDKTNVLKKVLEENIDLK